MLINEFEKQGAFLFRWRSFLPLLLLPLVVFFAYKYLIAHTVNDEGQELLTLLLALSVSLCGFLLRCLTVGYTPAGTSGRNTTEQLASELNQTGMYSLVRHPLYLANFVTFFGFILIFQSLSLLLIATLFYIIYYERIMVTEEAFLHKKFGAAYEAWSAKTSAIFPVHLNWKKPPLPFSFKKILRREPPGFLLICIYFPLLEFLEDVAWGGDPLLQWLQDDFFLAGLAGFGLMTFAILWTMRKTTNLLYEPGR